ncbi:MAG: FKBP-type peptidyl-prolyl cis-trans isomerase [Saprospiraceae bacterium]|nr:FKBP-type peptidyl-prolyl cis-trans isomerase [Saprospiraceae bacterium]MCB9320850.1 FKBP-type peptidyl-prolyl cis-trans isomerase [Lewinellaceae bacterium]
MNSCTLVLIGLTTLLIACGQTPRTTEPETDTDLAVYSYYHTNPATQFEREENAIIDYLGAHYPGATRLDSGIYLKILDLGSGDPLKWGDLIQVDYKVSYADGRMIDGTERRGEPLKTYIGNGVDGWNQALQQLHVGSHAVFGLTSSRAYKEKGLGNAIPPDTPLIFEVTIEKILDPSDY